ncbi:MBL fold metallo-hydrolase [Pyrodictium abyssi]|uniref:MBL fold metallo-hydrolase n=1 Tax=Pyrodictium abyssi TaxID=54256 RepID=A0ABM8IZ22_9CREN|nr:MBL fold metallo-hydrolase [Pyrodictium abyssi]
MQGLRRIAGRVYLLPGSPNTVIVADSGRAVVVDPGIGEDRSTRILRALEELGLGLEALVLTHGHSDHLAAAAGLEAPVYAPRLCLGLVESSVLRRLAVYGGLVSEQLASMPLAEVKVDKPVEPGGSLPGGLRALALPGHTPGHMGVVDDESMVVAAGDAVLGERVLARFGVPFAADLEEWARSLEKLRELAEEGYTLVPGHGPVARGRRAVSMVDANLAAVERVRGFVLEKLREKPVTLDRLAYLATVSLGSAEPTPRQLLLNRTALASVLAWLEREGLAEPVAAGEGVAWRARIG